MKLFFAAAVLALLTGASSAVAADKNYTRGPVWLVNMVKTEPGRQDDYLDSLKAQYTRLYGEAVKEKVITSFKVLRGEAATPTDWDILILLEVPNFSAFDTLEAKMDAIGAKLFGSEDKADQADKQTMTERAAIRKVLGTKVVQEIQFAE